VNFRKSFLPLGLVVGIVGAGFLIETPRPVGAAAQTKGTKLHVIATAEGDGEIEECG